ncbi:MAG: gliding motility-associated C-terminal domain-containing protein, partial [Gelidibacter sp.]|nr:gliding motility-associated C-terminal domain-containing protein [Gelidibacter sp.]
YWSIQTIATSGCENITKTVVTVSIISIPPPTTVASNQSFCEIEKATIADLNVTGSQVLWYATETSTTPLNTTTLLANGAYWASQTETVSGCESATRLVVNVSITTVPPPTTATANQSFCMKDYFPNTPTVGNLNVTGNSVRWYATATSLTPLNSTDLLTNGTSYWATQTDATSGCESASRLMVNVALINPATPTTSVVNQAFCLANKPTVSNLLVNESNVLWYNTETSTTPLNTTDVLVNGGNYWAANLNVATGCESISRLRVTVSVTDVAPAVINTVSQTFCQSNSPTIANLAATGNGIVWYATQTGTVALNPTSLLVNGSSYWAAQSNSTTGCVSSVRVVANVTVTTIATPTLISLGNEFCKIDNPTIADLNINVSAVNGGVITWYNAYPNGNLLSASTALVEGETYYAIETSINGCKSINPLAVTVTLEACDQYDVVIYDGFSPTGNGTNDTFKIGNLRELYPDFKVEYYNRWGNLVYTASAANPDWNGRLNGDGELSPAGVYYFIIYFNKNDRKPIQRRLYLSR